MAQPTRKKRKRRPPQADAAPPPEQPSAIKRGYARGEERNQIIREGLEPLAPGERPGILTVAAAVALLCAIANVAAALFGSSLDDDGAMVSTASFSVVLVVAAIGMWFAKYWAVLGFQALLALQVMVTSIAAIFALATPDLLALPLIVVSVAGGWLFWKLVRVLARLQMPQRRPDRPPVI